MDQKFQSIHTEREFQSDDKNHCSNIVFVDQEKLARKELVRSKTVGSASRHQYQTNHSKINIWQERKVLQPIDWLRPSNIFRNSREIFHSQLSVERGSSVWYWSGLMMVTQLMFDTASYQRWCEICEGSGRKML